MKPQYIFFQSVKNLARYKKRYIISGLFLLCAISVLSCALYYSSGTKHYIWRMKDEYLTRVNFKFRTELQWQGDEFFFNNTDENTGLYNDKSKVFNSDGSMDKYNVPVYVNKDYFDNFAKSDYVCGFKLAYTENVHDAFRITADTSESRLEMWTAKRNTNFMFGGSFSDFCYMFNGVDSSGMQITLSEGREHGNEECLIYADTAREYGYNVGDYITYNDADGNELGSIKISGLFSVSLGGNSDFSEFATLRIFGTNPFFRNNDTYIKYMIITDFDTVYSLKDDRRHEINSYIAWYELDDYRNFDSFVSDCGNYEQIDTTGFYPDTARYNDSAEVAEQITDVSWWFMAATAALSGVIIIIMTVYMLRERSRETGILYALGASGGSIVFGYLLETTFFLCVVACISLGTGRILTKLFETSAEYIQNMFLQYQITPTIILFLAILVLSGDLLSTGILSVSILKQPPAVLISAK